MSRKVRKSKSNTPEKETLQCYAGIAFLIRVNYLFGKLKFNVFLENYSFMTLNNNNTK